MATLTFIGEPSAKEEIGEFVRTVANVLADVTGHDLGTADRQLVEETLRFRGDLIQSVLDAPAISHACRRLFDMSLVRQYLELAAGGSVIRPSRSPALHVINELCDRAPRLRSTLSAQESIVEEFLRVLNETDTGIVAFTPLQNFDASDTCNMVQACISIERMERQVGRMAWLLEQGHHIFDDFSPEKPFWAVVARGSTLDVDEFRRDAEARFRRVLDVLRLLKSEPVGISALYVVPAGRSWHPFWESSAMRLNTDGAILPTALGRYCLTDEDIPGLDERYAELAAKMECLPEESQRRWRRAMARYQAADWAEQPIADLAVGLETILLPGVSDELRFRLSQRAALLVGRDQGERKRLFKAVKTLYDNRSKTVHGEESEIALENVQESREIMRRVLAEMLSRPEVDLNTYFDELPLR